MNVDRRNISMADKNRLIECFSNDEDYILLARHFEINSSSARTIVRRFKYDLHKNSHGGNKAPSINAETGESLLEFVTENPLCTLEVMRSFLSSKWLDGSRHSGCKELFGDEGNSL